MELAKTKLEESIMRPVRCLRQREPAMTEISKYVDSNGNFTHIKIEGSKEDVASIIQQYRETEFYKQKTDSQKIIMEHYFFPQIVETGMVPQGMLLELVMPSAKIKSFDDVKVGTSITFDLPPKYKDEK